MKKRGCRSNNTGTIHIGRGLIVISLTVLLHILLAGCSGEDPTADYDPVEMVNPLMGTDSEFILSNGNTYPAIALPWGMNFWTPQTGNMNDGWAYTYDDYKIQGIKQTHQPSPWINDYAAFSLMPVTGNLRFRGEERASWFSHKAEVASPHYYSVYLADHDVTAEVTPTDRSHFLPLILHLSSLMLLIWDRW